MFRRKTLNCKHQWKNIARRYTPPIAHIKHLEADSKTQVELAQRSLFGFTVIEQLCEICKYYKFTVVNGDQTNGKNL